MPVSLSAFNGISMELFILVFMRMSGLFIFNPIFGRENIPMKLRAAMGFLCAVVVTPTLSDLDVKIVSLVQLVIMSLGEIFIGLAVGIVVSILLYAVQLSGELIDMQMGLTMAKMFDTRTGITMPLFGSFFNLVMILCFFASNAHLSLVAFMTDSFRLIAPGAVVPTASSMQFVVSLLKDYFELGLRLAMPIVAIEVVAQIGIGLLMRAVPAINVFTIGMHITALVGLVVLVVTMTSAFALCGQIITFMMEKVTQVIRLIGTGT